MANRNNRESETREMSQTKYNIKDFSDDVLPNPTPNGDDEFLYVRTSVMGQDDVRNVIKKGHKDIYLAKKKIIQKSLHGETLEMKLKLVD
jgi:hypothetical protein